MTIQEATNLINQHKALKKKKDAASRPSTKLKYEQEMAKIVKILNDNEVWVCSICNRVQIGYLSKNNAYPVAKTSCCDVCNQRYVIPERIKQNGGFFYKQ